MPTKYDKLVRDRIPGLIEDDGQRPITHIADRDDSDGDGNGMSESEYADRLAAKLLEEAAEFEDDRDVDELADVLAVIHAILDDRGWTMAEVEERRREKRSERGGFDEGIVLERVEE